jgi:hypothetical protein
MGASRGSWPAISFARGTGAESQLKKLNPDAAILTVCVSKHAPAEFRGRITGIALVENSAAPTAQLVEPEAYERSAKRFGRDRWPTAIPIRRSWRFVDPPLVREITDKHHEITGTRGRYLKPIDEKIYDRLADLEVEEIRLYRSPD